MVERYLRQSALAHLELAARVGVGAESAGVRLSDGGFTGQLLLRGNGEGRFRMAAVAALGTALPFEPNRVTEHEDVRAIWLGPDEWLIVAGEERLEGLTRALMHELQGQPLAITDVSEARAVIGIAGPAAREVLSQGLSIDLHPSAFGPGQAAQTLLARVPIILHQRSEAPRYDLYVSRSLAEYLWHWLEDAGREHGIAVVAG